MSNLQSAGVNLSGFDCNQSLPYLYENGKWVTCELIEIVCFVIALYLLYALLHHRWIQNKRHLPLGLKKKGGALLENLCIAGISLTLIRLGNNQTLLFRGWSSTSFCSLLLNISIAMYFIAIHPVYLFLWVRQRIFYSNPALRHLYSKSMRRFSWCILVCFSMTTILSMIFFVIDAKNSASGRVCQLFCVQNNTGLSVEILDYARHQGVRVNILAGIVVSVIQFLFLVLFLYPIMDRRMRDLRAEHMNSGSKALMKLIKRSFLAAGCCIFSDIAIVFIIKYIHSEFPDAIFAPLATYDVNLILNFLSMIVTFRNWKRILFPWYYYCLCSSKRKAPQTRKRCLSSAKSSLTC